MIAALFIVATVSGLAILIWGAVRFIDAASNIAANIGISPLVIGLTIVAFGTSLPEMLVSALASFDDAPDLGIGNAIGSNIANIGLVLGLATLIMPITVRRDTLKCEFPLLALVTMIALLLILDRHLGRLDGVFLFSCFIFTLFGMAWLALYGSRRDATLHEMDQVYGQQVKMTTQQAVISFFIGLVALLGGSKAMVWGATGIATLLGVSDFVIGLTIVAIGTSLPELSASLVSAFKRQHDIAVGNILGSNTFNILAVLAMPGLIHPSYLDNWLLRRDFAVMVILFILLYLFARAGHQGQVGRFAGFVMLMMYIMYSGTLAYTSKLRFVL